MNQSPQNNVNLLMGDEELRKTVYSETSPPKTETQEVMTGVLDQVYFSKSIKSSATLSNIIALLMILDIP